LISDAVALGVEDAKLGQHIVLVVSPASGMTIDSNSLLARMRPALPQYMLPQRVEIKAEIHRSPNGKLDRALLRKELTG
jgi:acyl-CoA synthetase (AMP-forming)/AMP-acid ligase II